MTTWVPSINAPVPPVALVAVRCLPAHPCATFHMQGQPFCFSFGGSDEAILCWDLRTRRCLYELATGNTDVVSLQARRAELCRRQTEISGFDVVQALCFPGLPAAVLSCV